MYSPLDGPSSQGASLVTSSVVFRVKLGATEQEDRQVVSIMPLTGNIWVMFGDGITTPNAVTVKDRGFPQLKGALRTYEASNRQFIFIVADSVTTDVRFAERG